MIFIVNCEKILDIFFAQSMTWGHAQMLTHDMALVIILGTHTNICRRHLMDMMPIDQITVNNSYLRTETDIETLKASIDMVGLIHPLTVNSKNELLAGGRRYSAMKELGWSEVPVSVVDKSALEQELISIDENLVRKPLNKIEFEQCLNRGREIYEELNPAANKVDMEVKSLSPAQKKAEKEADDDDNDSFAAITSEKTGLSKSVIKSAIRRDALSSEKVKELRNDGTLSATHANELIKLDKESQDLILPFIGDRPSKEVKKIVDIAKLDGVDYAIEKSHEMQPVPREIIHLKTMVKRLNKTFARIFLEDINYTGPEKDGILKDVSKLRDHLENYTSMMEANEMGYGASSSEEFTEDVTQ